MPHRSSVPLGWRLKRGRYTLIGTKCNNTGEIYFPPRLYCKDSCDPENIVLSGKGEIVSFTQIHAAPGGFEEYVPYVVGLVKFFDGPMVSAQIINPISEVSIGKVVVPVFRKITEDGNSGIIHYGIKFEVIDK
jgi:uncharacterized protein